MRSFVSLIACIGGLLFAPSLAMADQPQCPFFRPDCCSKKEASCNLPAGCSCQDFEAVASETGKTKKRQSRRNKMSAQSRPLPANMTGTWRIAGRVPSDEPQCSRQCGGRPVRCVTRCGPRPPPSNTCSFVVTSRTFNVVARETSRGITAKVDDSITLSGYRESASSAFLAAQAYYPEFACTANVSLRVFSNVFSSDLLLGSAQVDWTCRDPQRSCFVKYTGTFDQL